MWRNSCRAHRGLLVSALVAFISVCSGEQSSFPEYGFYSYHPHYNHDLPPARPLPKKIPFGMPMGGYSMEGNGPPFGLVAFYFDAFGHHFDFNSPFSLLLLKQLIRLSSELAPSHYDHVYSNHVPHIPFNGYEDAFNFYRHAILKK